MIQRIKRINKLRSGLRNQAEDPGNVSTASAVMDLSRDRFLRYRVTVEDGGVEALSGSGP